MDRSPVTVPRWATLAGAAGLVALVPGLASAQSFTPLISPNPVTLTAGGATRTVTVMTRPADGFSDPITYSFSGFPTGISTGGSQTVSPVPAAGPPQYPSVDFPFSAAPGVAPGTYAGRLVGMSPALTRTLPMTVIVEAPPPDFALAVSPSSLSITGGGSASVSVQVIPINGFTGVVSVTSPSLAGITLTPSSFDLGVTGSQTVTIAAGPATQAGTVTGLFRGTAPSVSGQRTAPVTVQVTAPPAPPPSPPPAPPPPAGDFALSVTPPSLTLAPGESATLNVSATGAGGFGEPILVTAPSSPALAVQPSSFTLLPGSSQTVALTVGPSTPLGTSSLVFTGGAAGVSGVRTAATTVIVAAVPAIDAITPPSVVAGTVGNLLRVTGRNFEPGATITSDSPVVQVTTARILGPAVAEVVVTVRPDAAAGPYRLELTNPDGRTASGVALLLVYPPGSLGAPLAVTAAAIVAPRPWQIVEPGESPHSLALLATSGMGTVVGTWLLDGVPFDRFTRLVSGGYPVEVRSRIPIPRTFTGEHRLELLIESPQSLAPQSVPFFQAVESRTTLKVLDPSDGASLDFEDAAFRWTLVPGASGYEVEIEGTIVGESSTGPTETRPWTAVRRRVTDTEWRPEAALLEMLGAGETRFRVRAVFPGEVPGEPTPWRSLRLVSPEGPAEAGGETAPSNGPEETGWQGAPFRLVSTVAPQAATAGSPSAQPSRPTDGTRQDARTAGQLGLTLMSTTTTIASEVEDPPPLTRLQLSAQTDLRSGTFDQQATTDLAGSHDLEDPWDAREESRNWLTRLGAAQGRVREEFAFGFAPPSFFDQTEFMTVVGTAGALQGTFASPAGRLAYYRSLDLSANGSFGGPRPEIDAAAYEAADEAGRFLFRTMLLQVTDPEVDGFSSGGDGKGLGVIGIAQVRPWLRLLGEAAGGDYEPGEGSFEEARDGNAFRLALDGTAGTFGYAFAVGRTGEGFVNPANRGFTPGGISDRTRAELSLQKYLGRAALSGTYRHIRGGVALAAGDPETTENGAAVRLAVPIGQRVSLNAGGNVVGQRARAIADLGLPRTDRTQRGFDLSFTESVGPLSLTQGLTWQELDDRAQPLSDQAVTGLSLSASGAPLSFLSLSANVSHTSTEAAPEIGTTDQVLLSLQPALSLPKLWLTVTPRSAWSRTSNDVLDSEFKSDQYQVVARWSPPWLGALLNLEVSSDWNRSWSHLDEPPSFDRRTVLTITLNWRADRVWGPLGQAETVEQAAPSLAGGAEESRSIAALTLP